ncbi:MAG: type II toxin-antitoxin system RatA family toxin [Betaproteobacteria bacterium]
MNSVRKSVIVSHSAQRMYALVDGVEAYPAFLPWCGGASESERTATSVLAEIQIAYHGLRQSFVTRNDNHPSDSIDMNFVRGPFRSLAGHWRFVPIGDAGCRVEFALDWEFANAILERAVGPVFNSIVNNFVDAFVRRADALYPS